MTTAASTPMLLRPTLLPKVWGGRRLETLGKQLAAGELVGESWELADMVATSTGGAGGQPVRSVIVDGPLAGKTLHEALGLHGEAIMGSAAAASAAAERGFPLLFKFLDAAQPLSVQVHPSPSYASRTKGVHIKTESWYIVAADAGAKLFIGVKPGITRSAFALAARNSDPQIVGMLREVPAIAGQCHTLPSGTIHALGAGVLAAEVQSASDTTFRIYDWGRDRGGGTGGTGGAGGTGGTGGRELHIADALRCCRFEDDPLEARIGPDGPATVAALGKSDAHGRIAATEHYTIDEFRPRDGAAVALAQVADPSQSRGPAPVVVMTLAGSGTLSHAGSMFPPRTLAPGQTLLIPAISAAGAMVTGEQGLRILSTSLRG